MKKVSKDYIIREAETGRIYKITEDYDPITNYEPTEKEKQDFLNRETTRLKQQEIEQQQTKGNQVRRFHELIHGQETTNENKPKGVNEIKRLSELLDEY